MSLILYADSYAHSPQADVTIDTRSIMDEDGTKNIGTSTTWNIKGIIVGTSISDIKTKITALEAAYASPTALYLKDGVTARETLDGSLARTGLLVEGISYPQGNKADYATKRTYTMSVSGEFYDGGEKGDSDILFLEEKTRYATDINGKTTRTIVGMLKTKDGVSAESKFPTVTPSVYSDSNRTEYSKEMNDDDNEMSYSFTDVEYWIPWPIGDITDGSHSVQTSDEENGIKKVSITGMFTGGVAAQTLADALKRDMPQYKALRESQETHPYSGSVSFNYEYIDLYNSTTDLITWNENTSLVYSVQDFVMRPALDGKKPERQNTILTTAQATQSGNAIGVSDWPAYPAYLWGSADKKSDQRTKSGPDMMPDGTYSNYSISWSYTFEFATDPTFHNPNTA